MSDKSKLPINRVDGLNNELNNININVESINESINLINQKLNNLEFVGMIISGVNSNAPLGWLICNGQAISRTDYNKLFEVIGTTYGNGDGTSTFNVPDYRGLLLQMVTGNQQIGTNIEAGLPNITGHFGGVAGTSVTGAFNIEETDKSISSGSTGTRQYLTFNASRSSSIYGKSDTVQPPVSLVNYFIKY